MHRSDLHIRSFPECMDISQPVCIVEMTLIRLKRELDPQDAEKKKIVKSRQEKKLNSSSRKVRTESQRDIPLQSIP